METPLRIGPFEQEAQAERWVGRFMQSFPSVQHEYAEAWNMSVGPRTIDFSDEADRSPVDVPPEDLAENLFDHLFGVWDQETDGVYVAA